MDLESGTRRNTKVSYGHASKPSKFQFFIHGWILISIPTSFLLLFKNAALFFLSFFFFYYIFLIIILQNDSWKTVLTLAYQSLGVVYGDLSISPLYVFRSTFGEGIGHSETNEEIYGVLSLVFWSVTLVPLFKYVFIVLKADDNGEGGTFALYSLLCRHAKVNSLPNCQLADEELYEYKNDAYAFTHDNNKSFAFKLKATLEKREVLQKVLLVLALIGTCMVIGDGVITPALSGDSSVLF